MSGDSQYSGGKKEIELVGVVEANRMGPPAVSGHPDEDKSIWSMPRTVRFALFARADVSSTGSGVCLVCKCIHCLLHTRLILTLYISTDGLNHIIYNESEESGLFGLKTTAN